MKYICLILLSTLISCVKNNQSIKVFACNPKYNDSVIKGSELNLFFEENNSREITINDIVLTNNLNIEIDKLKYNLLNKNIKDTKMGIYYFAIIRDKDTLYSSSDLRSWKYKDVVGLYDSKIIIYSIIGDYKIQLPQ